MFLPFQMESLAYNLVFLFMLQSIYVYFSESEDKCSITEDHLLYKRENQLYSTNLPYHEVNITLPVTQHLLTNGSLYAHMFFGKSTILPSDERGCVSTPGQSHSVYRTLHVVSLINRIESL